VRTQLFWTMADRSWLTDLYICIVYASCELQHTPGPQCLRRDTTRVFAQSVLQRHCARLLYEGMVHSNQAASQDLRFVTVHLLPPVLAYWVDCLKREPAARETPRAAGPVAYIETDDEHMSNTLVGLHWVIRPQCKALCHACVHAGPHLQAAREHEPRCGMARQRARSVLQLHLVGFAQALQDITTEGGQALQACRSSWAC